MTDTLKPCPFCPDGGTPQAHTDAEYVTCKTCGCVVEYAVWQTRAAPSVEGEDWCDLMVDEFRRIKALFYGEETTRAREVIQLCERAITNTKQRVPLIDQRDNLERECIDLRVKIGMLQPQTDNSAALEALDRVFEIISERDSDLYGGTSECSYNEYCVLGNIIRAALQAAPSVEGDALCVIERTLNGLLHTKLGADYRENVITSLEVLARLKQTKQQTDYLQSPESVSTKTGGKDNENNAIKSRPECMAAWPLVDKAMAKLGGV